jgi:hypothetical protein
LLQNDADCHGEADCLPSNRKDKWGGWRVADWEDEVRYFRQKAQQFRNLANQYDSVISGHLLDIAAELDRRADKIEREHEGPG